MKNFRLYPTNKIVSLKNNPKLLKTAQSRGNPSNKPTNKILSPQVNQNNPKYNPST